MSIPTKSLMKGLLKEVQTLEQRHGTEVPTSAIRNKALREIAVPVSTGCASTGLVKTEQLKRALKTVGKDIEKADANKDGRLNIGDQKRLSPMAARLLQAAGKDVASPDQPAPSVSTGCGASPAPSRPSVSTGCGASTTPSRPAVTPRPARPVSTGCGGSTPAPIRTGC